MVHLAIRFILILVAYVYAVSAVFAFNLSVVSRVVASGRSVAALSSGRLLKKVERSWVERDGSGRFMSLRRDAHADLVAAVLKL